MTKSQKSGLSAWVIAPSKSASADPDAWKQEFRPLDTNKRAFAHLRCSGNPGYVGVKDSRGRTDVTEREGDGYVAAISD